ncbi:MAG: cytidine deaminase [Bacteroidales bacterium]|nr:cytidine deaminase [Bacteroidales bacterium]
MRTDELRILVYTYNRPEELPGNGKSLIDSAKEAAHKAWAPYSNFHVGAALDLENGEIITGNNQENIAFPAGLCAERVALFYAGSQYPGVAIKRIALVAYSDDRFVEKPVFPCGDCRQSLLEHENRVGKNIEVIMYGTREIKVVKSIRDLLPLPFDYQLAGKGTP